ncbi:MAG TPA: acetylglutamate kinase [Bacteroidia bacterium]|jgi:acetylglutamate kinase|nr:acetylglutamate kinase [Bacteroidia bacterium]
MNKKELTIVKIGGNIIDNADKLQSFLEKFNAIKGGKILVHGGGKLATEMSARLGIEAKMVNGRRITDLPTLEIVAMVYSGINKAMAAKLSSMGAKSIGVCGADLNLIPAAKRIKGDIDYGFVGDILQDKIPVNDWALFLEAGICPVVAPITADASGQLLNTNADTIASSLAQVLSQLYSVRLIYCFEKNGVLKNQEDENSVLPVIKAREYAELHRRKIISEGMIPKLDNAWEAVKQGVDKVIIGNAAHIEKLSSPTHITGTLLVL